MNFDNREFSAAVQSAAESKLGRSLTPNEEHRIWNLGSFMQLETVDRNIAYANSGKRLLKSSQDSRKASRYQKSSPDGRRSLSKLVHISKFSIESCA